MIFKNLAEKYLKLVNPNYLVQARGLRMDNKIKYGMISRRKANMLYWSLEDRMNSRNPVLKDPELYEKRNIGRTIVEDKATLVRKKKEQSLFLKEVKKNSEMEKAARLNKLDIDIEKFREEWSKSIPDRAVHAKNLAEHFNIFSHLFGDYAFFHPIVEMNIEYDYLDTDMCSPVYYGNLLKPIEVKSEPKVKINFDKDCLYTLVVTNPDGNLYENDKEVLHWFVANISQNDISKGDVITDYMRPFPPYGTGYHRCVFTLYEQNDHIDFWELKRESPCLDLQRRSFSTYDFYKKYENQLTPVGLQWFQVDWDTSLTDFFHNTLKMKQPSYEYEFPQKYFEEERLVPDVFDYEVPFNRYLERYKDPKDINKNVLKDRLKKVDPINGDLKEYTPYPLINLKFKFEQPAWEYWEQYYKLQGMGKYRKFYKLDFRPPVKRHEVKEKRPPHFVGFNQIFKKK